MAFKRWSGGGVRATAILDGVCARCHWAQAGRDGETALRSNKETGPKDRKILGQHTTFLTKCPIQGWAKRSVPTLPRRGGHGARERAFAHPTDASSPRRSAGVGDLRILDTIKHELLARENSSKARRIGIFVADIGKEHVEVIVVRCPTPPIIVSARIAVAHAQQVFDRWRAAVLGVDPGPIVGAHLQHPLPHHCKPPPPHTRPLHYG